MSAAARTIKSIQAETDIAVLQVQVKNIDNKVDSLKEDLKDVNTSIDKHAETTAEYLKGMKDVSTSAHNAMSAKINSLEKWRWMLMGAGIVVGSLGFDTISKLLK